MAKFIFVTGGVVSSIGKGITTASIGRILRNRGFSVSPIKLDPYINVDAGTMNPYQHGEVFVTEDGAETDLDLGHYERFIDVNCSGDSSITTGKVYASVIESERRGDYLGGTVQVIPHITNEIKKRIYNIAKNVDIVIAEIGGTIGDIESLPFLEAIRQFRKEVGIENSLYVHVTLIPTIGPWKEIKTKPTQHSVVKLREIGITPDILICRTEIPLGEDIQEKISLFCDVPQEAIIESIHAQTIYEIPILFEQKGLGNLITKRLKLSYEKIEHQEWENIVDKLKDKNHKYTTTIGVIGKYTTNGDAYKSIEEALIHAGTSYNCKVNIKWYESDQISDLTFTQSILPHLDGLIVAPGFGSRGIEGKIEAIRYVRENNIPFLGICYGMQCAVVEFARNVCGFKDAHTQEADNNTSHPVVHLSPNQERINQKGGTMRLGSYDCILKKESMALKLYQKTEISERHRHRYEVNTNYKEHLINSGMEISGTSCDGKFIEIIEIPSHSFFIATQAHPEFKSRPNRPHPLFEGFIKATIDLKKVNQNND